MDIQIRVDPTNPGQFFACCGLLELADRLWGNAEGAFSDTGTEFFITAGARTCIGGAPELRTKIASCESYPERRIGFIIWSTPISGVSGWYAPQNRDLGSWILSQALGLYSG